MCEYKVIETDDGSIIKQDIQYDISFNDWEIFSVKEYYNGRMIVVLKREDRLERAYDDHRAARRRVKE